MNIKSLAILAATLIATSAYAGETKEQKCGAGSCGKKEHACKDGANCDHKQASCSKKDAACSKKDGACAKKDAACSKKDGACSKKEAACSKKDAACSKK